MSAFLVSLSSIEDVRRFVNAATRCTCEVDVLSGRYVVDAKSIMGLFSLDLSQPVEVKVHGSEEERAAFEREIESLSLTHNA
ncbi:HPr family phosphocarrier protein [Flavonifractor hominis]|uniref:HPr family phosphocarrier protein n=1 Tax=Flavonifractor hominis TaxID=3133178 RepID=A0ABV1EP73_9FIRM